MGYVPVRYVKQPEGISLKYSLVYHQMIPVASIGSQSPRGSRRTRGDGVCWSSGGPQSIYPLVI